MNELKLKGVIYLLIITFIASGAGAGFFWYASRFNPEVNNYKITKTKPSVLGEQIIEEIVSEEIVEEIIIDEQEPVTQTVPQQVIQIGMSSSEVNGLFLTYYKREANQDELT